MSRSDSKLAHRTRGTFKGQVTAISSLTGDYSVTTSSGATYASVKASDTWETDDWVTVVKTDQGYAIIGYAASGPVDIVAPEEGS